MMTNIKTTQVTEIGSNILQKQFFSMLPENFSKQDAITQAQVLGVNIRTMEDWLEKSIQQTVIERVAKGKYHKRIA